MHKNKIGIKSIMVHFLLLVITFIMIVPIFWLMLISISYPQNAFDFSLKGPFTLNNYIAVFSDSINFFKNSLIVSVLSTIISLSFGITAAYGISRFNIKKGNIINMYVMSVRMFPPVLLSIGFFQIIIKVKLFDNLASLIIMCSLLSMPFVFWMMQTYFNAIPKEIDEAGLIDGCSHLSVMFKLIMPISTPGIIATAVYAFLMAWKDFLFATTFIQSQSRKTATVGLAELQGEWWTNYPHLIAMSMLLIIPTMLLFILSQKYLIPSLASYAVKQ